MTFLASLLPDFGFELVYPMFDGAIIRPTKTGSDARTIKAEVEKVYGVQLRVSLFAECADSHSGNVEGGAGNPPVAGIFRTPPPTCDGWRTPRPSSNTIFAGDSELNSPPDAHPPARIAPGVSWTSDRKSAHIPSCRESFDGSGFSWETGAQSSVTEDHLDMSSLSAEARESIEDRDGVGEFREHLRLGTSARSSTPDWSEDARDVCTATQSPGPSNSGSGVISISGYGRCFYLH